MKTCRDSGGGNLLPGTVDGDRIVLKEIVPAYFEIEFSWLRSESLRRELVITRYPYSEEETVEWYAEYRNNPSRLIYVAFLKEAGIALGQIGFNRIDYPHRNGEMHIFIGDPEDCGKGYAQEMLSLFLRVAFKHLNLLKVWLKVNDDNLRAIRFYEKTGFVREGFLRNHEIYHGELLSKYLYSFFSDSTSVSKT